MITLRLSYGIVGIFALACIGSVVAAPPSFKLLWNFSQEGVGVESAPSVADLTGDGYLDVVFAIWEEGSTWVIAVNGLTGKEIWRYGPTTGTTGMLIDDINGDSLLEVVFVAFTNKAGEIVALNGPLGGLLWKYDGGYQKTHLLDRPASADINGDGRKEVVFAPRDASGRNTTAFDGVSGDIVWESRAVGAGVVGGGQLNYKAPCCIADIEGDGGLEVITNHIGFAWIVDASTGLLKYELQNAGIADGAFVVHDVNGDGLKEMIVMGAYNISCYHPDTSQMVGDAVWLWDYDGGRTGYNNVVGADFDGDGKLEVINVEQGGSAEGPDYGFVQCRNAEDGTMIWNMSTLGKFVNLAPAVGDLDGDGLPDLLMGCEAPEGGFSYALKGTSGDVLWNQTMNSRTENCGAIADVDGNGKIDVVIGDQDQMLCFETSTDCPFGYIAWGMPNHDPWNSAIFPMPEAVALELLGLVLAGFAVFKVRRN